MDDEILAGIGMVLVVVIAVILFAGSITGLISASHIDSLEHRVELLEQHK